MNYKNFNDLPSIPLGEVKLTPFVGKDLMMVKAFVPKGSVVPMHHHVHEQMTYVLSGSLRIKTEGKEITLKTGEVISFLSDVPHEVVALEDTDVIDVFNPIREDFVAQLKNKN